MSLPRFSVAISAELIKTIEPQHNSIATFDEKQNAKYDLSVAESRLRSAVRSRLKRAKRRLAGPFTDEGRHESKDVSSD
jgi:hypothetical protein